MNYLLKRQASSGVVVECLLRHTQKCKTMYCSCKNCVVFKSIFQQNASVMYSSTYISALKVHVERKKPARKSKNSSKKKVVNSHVKNFNQKELEEKNVTDKKILELDKLKKLVCQSRQNVDSTKSYDPNFFNSNLQVDKFYQQYAKRKNYKKHPHSVYLKALENLEFPASSSSNTSQIKQVKHEHIEKNVSPVFKLLEVKKNQKFTNQLQKLFITPMDKVLTQPKVTSNLDVVAADASILKDFSVILSNDLVLLECFHSTLDIYTTYGRAHEALELLMQCRKKLVWKQIAKSSPQRLLKLYNCVLRAIAYEGKVFYFEVLKKCMQVDNVKFDSETFAALFHCLAVANEVDPEYNVISETQTAINSIFRNNISLNDIFVKTELSKEVSDKILTVIRLIVPSFEIQPLVTELCSDCSLLKNLYSDINRNIYSQSPVHGLELDLDRLVEEQIQVEKAVYVEVKAVSSSLQEEVLPKTRDKVEKLKVQWKNSLKEAVLTVQKTDEKIHSEALNWLDWKSYFSSVPVDKFVDVLMETTLNLVQFSGCYSPSSSQFSYSLGSKFFQCYQLRKSEITGLIEKTEKLARNFNSWYINPSFPAMNSRQKWQMLLQDSERTGDLDPEFVKWPTELQRRMGKKLLEIIIKNIKFSIQTTKETKTLPVFYTVLRYREGIFREEIKCHPIMTKLFEKIGFDVFNFRADEVPMLCPPKPWKSPKHGGYYFLQTEFIRKPFGIQGKKILLNDMPPKQLYAVMDSLNALQAVPWKINEKVLDVALEVFKNGGSTKLSVPVFPEKPPPQEKFDSSMDLKDRRELYFKRKELVKNLANNYGLWCEALYRLSLANHFRNKVFWLPQNLDFRGRVYPVPPLLNHLGSDLFRSLLSFAKGEPLGPKGLDWLKIHTINLTGTHKKKPVEERLKYANEILPEILDSAEKPLTGNKWWMESEDPWQTLAGCMEVKNALSVPNPELYICNFPVHQDGSCNGLQHYAALGRDLIGARSVNLVPCSQPQDVYTVVAEIVEKERARDATDGVLIAKVLNGFIERKVVKQTVMTTVYGVTSFGAKLQIAKRLAEIPDFPPEHIISASTYLAVKTFFSLKQMFTSAREIQDWFISCANEICNRKEYVQWMSPLGLPIVQPYAKLKTNKNSSGRTLLPDRVKQRNAFPPNFIHCLDSCHMMLTALYCEQAGLTFASVHDCFWTHPNKVDIMNKICREQFVTLHSQPILDNLSSFLQKTFADRSLKTAGTEVFNAVPKKGDFDLKEVMKSVYFFS